MRLYARLYLHFLLVLVVVFAATASVLAVGARGMFQSRFATGLTPHVAQDLVPSFLAGDPAARDAEARRIAEQLKIDLTLRGPDGALLVESGNRLPPMDARALEKARAGAMMRGVGHDMWAAAPVVGPDGALLGYVQVGPRLRGLGYWLDARHLVALLVMLALVGIAAFPLARRISRPIDRLTAASRRFGDGDLSTRVDIPRHWRHRAGRHGELEQLMNAWNEMASRIESQVRGQRELLANVSHELRSPLARIRVALELLPRDAEVEARLKDVEGDLGELDRLIEDVLTAFRLDANAFPLRREKIDVSALLGTLADRAKSDPLLAGKPVTVDAPAPLAVDADGPLLKRAVWNVLENAGKYGEAPIRLAAARENGSVTISVVDAGPGIAPAERETVFQPFVRGDKARTPSAAGKPSQGFGLGLTLARRIAEAHGGTIVAGAASNDGGQERGCKVTIALPT